MVRPIPIHISHDQTFSSSPVPLAIGLFVCITLVVSLCAKHGRKFQTNHTAASKTSEPSTPRQMITTISQKFMMPLVHAKKSGPLDEPPAVPGVAVKEEDGLWQKAILMGDKCQPPEFSGVIYYDYSGNRVPEMPKSPRHSSMTPFRSFNYQVEKDDTNSTAVC